MRERGDDAPAGTADLPRTLSLLDAAAIFVGIILGSGIFVAPAAVAGAAPGLPGAVLLWLAGGIVAACGAFCYAECGARLPRTGGFYVFYREVFGRPLAFVGGWAAVLVTYPASLAAIALVFARYLGEILPIGRAGEATAASALVVAGVLNVLGVRLGAGVQKALTGAKVSALAALTLAAALGTGAHPAPARDVAAFHPSWEALVAAAVVVLWTYDGWSDVTLVSGEIRDPKRDLGRAVLLGTGVLIVLYAIVQASVGSLLPAATAAGSDRVVADAVAVGLGPASGRLVALLVVVATFGSIHAVVLTASRIAFAMARDGLFPAWFGSVDPRWGTPARSIAGLAAASVAFVFVTGFRGLLAFFSFSVWIFYALTAVALLVLRRRGTGEPLAWRAPGGPVPPAVVLLVAAGMTSSLLVQDPKRSIIGAGILLAGFPAYAIWRAAARGRGY